MVQLVDYFQKKGKQLSKQQKITNKQAEPKVMFELSDDALHITATQPFVSICQHRQSNYENELSEKTDKNNNFNYLMHQDERIQTIDLAHLCL